MQSEARRSVWTLHETSSGDAHEPVLILSQLAVSRPTNRAVTVGLAALIIALCSSIWNIIGAVHSWRTSAPLVKVTLTSEHSEGYEALGINVRNIGGSPIAVVAALYVWFEHSMRVPPVFPNEIVVEVELATGKVATKRLG